MADLSFIHEDFEAADQTLDDVATSDGNDLWKLGHGNGLKTNGSGRAAGDGGTHNSEYLHNGGSDFDDQWVEWYASGSEKCGTALRVQTGDLTDYYNPRLDQNRILRVYEFVNGTGTEIINDGVQASGDAWFGCSVHTDGTSAWFINTRNGAILSVTEETSATYTTGRIGIHSFGSNAYILEFRGGEVSSGAPGGSAEDFTSGWTEGGAQAAQISQTSSKSSWANLDYDDEAHLTRTVTIAAGAFEFKGTVQTTLADATSSCFMLGAADDDDTFEGLKGASKNAILGQIYKGAGSDYFLLHEIEGGSNSTSSSDTGGGAWALSTDYYLTFGRMVNGSQYLAYAILRTGSHTGVVHRMLVKALTNNHAFTHVLGPTSREHGSASTGESSGYLENLYGLPAAPAAGAAVPVIASEGIHSLVFGGQVINGGP